MTRLIETVLPAMVLHEGVWKGRYSHLDAENRLIDEHNSIVRCEFPESGPYDYIQHNQFNWDDGREYQVELPGKLREDRLYWDTETFVGYAWQTTDNLILLNLDRKDEPNTRFFEMIVLSDSRQHRARTWHWFKDDQLIRRTLCNESRV